MKKKNLFVLVCLLILSVCLPMILVACDGEENKPVFELPEGLELFESQFSQSTILESIEVSVPSVSGEVQGVQLNEKSVEDFGVYKLYTYSVIYGNSQSENFEVKVYKDFESVSIFPDSTLGAKINFFVGESLDTTGWVLRFDYADGSIGSLEFDKKYLDENDYDMSKEGRYSLSVNIAGKRFDEALIISVGKYDNETLPVFDLSVEADKIEVVSSDLEDYEFRLTDLTNNSQGQWQSQNVFEGLLPNNKYKVEVRIKATSDTQASEIVAKEVVTPKYEQEAPNLRDLLVEIGEDYIKIEYKQNLNITIVDSSKTFIEQDGYLVAQGLVPNKTYTIQAFYEETATHYPSTTASVNILTDQKVAQIVVDEKNQVVEYDKMTKSLVFSLSDNSMIQPLYAKLVYYKDGVKLDGMPINVGKYTVDITYEAPEYAPMQLSGVQFEITPKEIYVTADDIQKTYGDIDPQLTYSVQGLIQGDVLSGELKRAEGEDVGCYDISLGSLANSNYVINYTQSSLCIEKATLTATVKDVEIAEDKTPQFELQFAGFKNNDDESVVELTDLQFLIFQNDELVSIDDISVGLYSVKAEGIFAQNYEIEYVFGELQVIAKDIDLTCPVMEFEYCKASVEYKAIDNQNIGYEFAYEYYDMQGQLTQPIELGEYRVKIIITGGDLTAPQTRYSKLFIVNRKLVIFADSLTKVYGQADPELTYSVVEGELLEGDAISGSLTRVAGENVGRYAINKSDIYAKNYDITLLEGYFEILPMSITVIAQPVSKGEGIADPQFEFVIEQALPFGDVLKGSLSRTAGESAGEYDITIGDLQIKNPNYDIEFVSAKLRIVYSFAKFDYSDLTFVYRVGTQNDMLFDIAYNDDYDPTQYPVYLEAVNAKGNAIAVASNEYNAIKFDGEGLMNVYICYDDEYGKVILDSMPVEVVLNAKNAFSKSDINFAKGDVCLHTDILLTSQFTTIPEGKALYGNNHIVDATTYNPTYRYQALISLYGRLENIQLIGRYAEDAFADSDEVDYFYKTITGISLYESGVIDNCYIKDTRYPVRLEGNGGTIQNTTIDGGFNSIYIQPTGSIQKLIIRDCDFIQMPDGDNMPGIAIYIDKSNASNLTIRFEGQVNFYCMLDKSTIEKMDSTYQTILNGLWNDFSDTLVHNIDGTEYFNATIAQYKESESSADFNIEYSDDCNLKDVFVKQQKSLTTMGTTFTGLVLTHGTQKLSIEEGRRLVAGTDEYKSGNYSPLGLDANSYYVEEIATSIGHSQEYILNYGNVEFEKYGQSMPFDISITQQSISGGYKIDSSSKSIHFDIGIYQLKYIVQDIIDNSSYEFVTVVNIGDLSPAPTLIFTYAEGKGKGTSADPMQWQGKELTSIFNYDNDYEWQLDLFFGVYAFDSLGNQIPRTSFTIELMSGDDKGTVYSNVNEANYVGNTNNFENNGYYKLTVKYTVKDSQGKSVSATRYFVRSSYSTNPDNGIAPEVVKIVDESQLEDKNIGYVAINTKGVMTLVDNNGQQIFNVNDSVEQIQRYQFVQENRGEVSISTSGEWFWKKYTAKCMQTMLYKDLFATNPDEVLTKNFEVNSGEKDSEEDARNALTAMCEANVASLSSSWYKYSYVDGIIVA